MDLEKETRLILKSYGIKASKELGQNFLINESVVNGIIESAQITNEDLIIEIGPGLGTLTSKLLEKAGKVIAVELDKRMISILEDRFRLYINFELINEDILKINLKEIINNNVCDCKEKLKKVKIVANLPYYITTPIIMKLLEEKLNIETITVMVQKEVADRLTAKPGEKLAGAITYTVYYYSDGNKIIKVPKESFIPEPSVDSEVIQLNIRKRLVVENVNEEILFKLIKYAFMERRKTLVNALVKSKLFENKQEIANILEELKIEQNVRGEVLTLEQFAQIANRIEKKD